MNPEKNSLTSFIEKESENTSPAFGETILRYLYYWPLFLICVAASLAAAWVYLHYHKPDYILKARLLIKTDNQGSNLQTPLNEIINPYQKVKTVEDEIEILKSRTLIGQVVNNLGLWCNYKKKGRVTDEDLYDRSPVVFRFISSRQQPEGKKLEVTIKDHHSFLLKEPGGEEKVFYFNSLLKDKLGTWKLEKTPFFDDFSGSTILISVQDPEVAADGLSGKVKASEVSKNASVVELTIQDKVLKRGKDILNSLIEEYNKAAGYEKERTAANAIQFIDQRLASLTGELTSVEKEAEGFRSSRGLTDISSESKAWLENVRTNDTHLNEVEVQLNIIREIEQYVSSPEITNDGAPSPLGISDPVLPALISKLIDLQLQYQQLLGTLPEKNPAFEPLRQQITATKNAIKQNIANIRSSLLATRRQLRSFNASFEGSIKSLPKDERLLLGIKRQQSIKENLYLYLLQKREEAALSHASNLTFSQTVDSAYADSHKKPLTYSLALLIGLIIPSGLLFGKELFSNRITTTKQVESTGVSVTGELIFEYTRSPIVVHPKSRYAIGEQFRSLRTSLQHLHGPKKSGRVTLVTSSIAGEGKSFVAANLGVALAASGRRTVILELDLRKPRIAKNFRLTESPGICDYLNGSAPAGQIVTPSPGNPGLFIISAGTLPENPSELLEQEAIDQLIAGLRSSFDDIIIDTPPVFLVTDAMIIARVADVSLYVVRQNYSYKKHLEFIRKLNHESLLPGLRAIFNGIQKRGEYGYGYEYYSSIAEPRKISFHAFLREVSSRLMLSNS